MEGGGEGGAQKNPIVWRALFSLFWNALDPLAEAIMSLLVFFACMGRWCGGGRRSLFLFFHCTMAEARGESLKCATALLAAGAEVNAKSFS